MYLNIFIFFNISIFPSSFFIFPKTDVMFALIRLHNDIMPLLIAITIFLVYMIGWCIYFGVFINNTKLSVIEPDASRSHITHNSILEIIWTVMPAIILIFIAIPSFTLLFAMDEITQPSWTLKVIGHQWYWSYEASTIAIDPNKPILEAFYSAPRRWDQYLLSGEETNKNYVRLLSTDTVVTIPLLTHTRVLVTSVDVIHSWAIPAYGIKMDACPGRLNQLSLNIQSTGLVSGQCSELCGVNHGFMPIAVKSV